MLKQILSIFSLEMGRIRPKYMGWAEPGPNTWAGPRPCEQCPPLFTCYVNSGGVAGTQQEKEEGEKG